MVSIGDDDTAGVAVSATSVSATEGSETWSYTVALRSAATATSR